MSALSPDLSGVLLAALVQGLVLAVALLSMARRSPANTYLALTLVVLSGMMSVFVLGWTGLPDVPPWLAFLPVNLPLALGPTLHGYITSLVTGEPPDRRHFIPAGVQLAYLLAMQVLPAGMQAAWKSGPHDEVIKPLVEVATVASLWVYSWLGLQALRRYRSWLAQQRSDADRYAAFWIGRVMLAFAATAAALALLRLYTTFVGELDAGPLHLWFAALGAWLGIEGWRQADRRYPVMQASPPSPAEEVAGPDWVAQGERWREVIRTGGWWRETDLTLADVARRLGTNTSYLSRAINDGLNLNFNELVNSMRTEEVARRIDAGDGTNFLQLALDAGFNSKATFNRAFKAALGQSPSEYRDRVKSRESGDSRGSEARSGQPSGK
jgi:AraC-like DNA-binding protein